MFSHKVFLSAVEVARYARHLETLGDDVDGDCVSCGQYPFGDSHQSCPLELSSRRLRMVGSGHPFRVAPAEFHFEWPINAYVGRVQHPREPPRYHGQVLVRLAQLLLHLVRQVAAKAVQH